MKELAIGATLLILSGLFLIAIRRFLRLKADYDLALQNLKEAWRERLSVPDEEPVPDEVRFLRWNQELTEQDYASARALVQRFDWAKGFTEAPKT